MDKTIAEIAAGLTKAQRRWLTTEAGQRDPYGTGSERLMTFPPPNTHRVLRKHGLVDKVGLISDLGLSVRSHLLNNTGEDR
ncbi:hypothetical protein GRI72_02725 [Altererythrobacter marinus]|uniref:DUF4224 domain-containing protein n=1 Tax=Pelagerythrobacter marinus TaxID=538382 RepID=A0ABW9UUV4_9SPHN|nr:hypothetical protein [Pelagerythrobacter marinus]MXO67746.1 hypothetical protein [Pelagerythrobacter marinus]